MKVLVIGGGGREHALVWKLKQSPLVEKIWCVPGNGGIAGEAECVAADAGDVAAIIALAEKLHPELTIVGPELPLVNGLTDAFRQRNWPIVGPSKQAAQLEGSKIFSKEFLLRHKIPTAKMYGAYDTAKSARDALSRVRWPVVIKADGLCAGKGVFLATDRTAAEDFIERAMEKGEFGGGGKRLLLEEALEGDELSFMILTDGERYAPLVPTRDHKRLYDGDSGPNTGGMGAYSTDDLLPEELRKTILTKILEPTLLGLGADGIRYQGFLYVGLMLTKSGPMVLEFNCRLGDPETQAIVARVDFDLADMLCNAAAGKLDPSMLRWKPGASVCVVLTSGGYPGKFATGRPISGLTSLSKQNGVVVFHSGTRLNGSQIVTNGGRVLGITALRSSLDGALVTVYSAAVGVRFEGMHYRKDIGARNSRLTAAGD